MITCNLRPLASAFATVSRRVLDAASAAPCTLFISLLAIVVGASEELTAMFELQRQAVASGQWWRLFTGHATHFGANHLAWDLAMFAALGWVCEGRWPARTRLTLLGSAIAISLSIIAFRPQYGSYRGLSGLDSALFGLLAVALLREWENHQNGGLITCLWILVAGFAAKLGYEALTGATFFVDSAAASFTPVPLAHAIGFVVGALTAAIDAPLPIGKTRVGSYD